MVRHASCPGRKIPLEITDEIAANAKDGGIVLVNTSANYPKIEGRRRVAWSSSK
jgi:hypothetical protein